MSRPPRIMVIEPGPKFSVQDVCMGWARGLKRAGADVAVFNFSDRLAFFENAFHWSDRLCAWVNPYTVRENMLLAADGLFAETMKLAPDIILSVSGFFVPIEFPQAVRDAGVTYVYLVTEAPYEDDTCIPRAQQADLTIVNDPTNLAAYPAGTYYQPHCYDPEIHHPRGRDERYDFSFVGTGYESRQAFFDSVDWTGISARFEGNWPLAEGSPIAPYITGQFEECFLNAHTADLYRSSRISANFYRRESNRPDLSAGWAMGPREVELAACGTFFLRDSRPESDATFPMLPTFESAEDFSAQLHWWIEHPDARRQAAAQASSAIADRTFENAARRLLSTLS